MYYSHLGVLLKPTPAASDVADPWAWSLETVISLVGVLATVAIAVVAGVYAVRTSRRQSREEDRQRRARLAAVIDRYLEARKNGGGWEEDKAMHDAAVAEGFAMIPPEVEWVERYAEDVMWLYRDMPKGPEGGPIDQGWWLAYLRRHGEVRNRLFTWVASGEFDLSPLAVVSLDDEGKPVFEEDVVASQ